MNKILPSFIIVALLLTGILLLYPRGGGDGLDPVSDSGIGQFFPARPKSAALPKMCLVDQRIDPIQKQPPSNLQLDTACTVDFPENLQVTSYCLNKATKLGGATISLPQGAPQYVNIPNNCTVVVDQEKLYAKTIVCSGSAGSTVNLTVQNSCTPPAADRPDVEFSCPEGYSLGDATKAFGTCQYNAKSNPLCPYGYMFDEKANCCGIFVQLPKSISACPEGYQVSADWSAGKLVRAYCSPIARGASTTDTRSYSITLGNCTSRDSDSAPAPVCNVDGICQ